MSPGILAVTIFSGRGRRESPPDKRCDSRREICGEVVQLGGYEVVREERCMRKDMSKSNRR